MKTRIWNHIIFKLALMVIAASSVVFGFVLAYSYTFSKEIILKDAQRRARYLSLSVARRIEQEFRAVEKAPLGIKAFLETPGSDFNKLDKLIERAVNDHPEVFGIAVAFEEWAYDRNTPLYCSYYYKRDGKLVFQGLTPETEDYLRLDWYHIPKILNRPVWVEPYFDDGAKELMTSYSVPFYHINPDGSQGAFRGIVVADISLHWLSELVASVTTVRDSFFFVISDSGRFVTHQKPEFIMRETIFSLAEHHNDEKMRELGRSMLQEGSGVAMLESTPLFPDGAILAHAQIPSPKWSLAAAYSKDSLLEDIHGLHRETLLISIVGILMMLIPSYLVARSIAKPLRKMAAAARTIKLGDPHVDQSYVRVKDEVWELAESLTEMSQGLKERDFIRDTFGRYLTKEVVSSILESKDGLKLGGEKREISVMMSDLRGFTALTSNMAPEDVIRFLNRYLGSMIEILIEYRGTIDEIIGDGILAFFGAPQDLDDHPERAVACALRMQNAMEQINELNEADGLPHLEMGIAINTGSVVVGNIGSEKRSKYGAVGAQINFTGRMESFTTGGQVLVSQSTYDKLSDKLEIKTTLSVEMKGVVGKVNLYQVVGLGGEHGVKLSDRCYKFKDLDSPLKVCFYGMEAKIIDENARHGAIVQLSPTSAVVRTSDNVGQWEDLRMSLCDPAFESFGDMYGKVVSIDKLDDYTMAMIRFTSVAPQIYKVFREAMVT